VDLLLALPRPKVLRRLLADLACLGVGAIHLTNAWRVERSYFSSPVLTPEAIGRYLRLGLEQAGGVRLPQVVIHRRLMAFLDETLPALDPTRRVVAEPGATTPIAAAAGPGRTLLALGPEGGWIRREVETLAARGFTPVSLGERILRTETAAVVAVAMVNVCRHTAGGERVAEGREAAAYPADRATRTARVDLQSVVPPASSRPI